MPKIELEGKHNKIQHCMLNMQQQEGMGLTTLIAFNGTPRRNIIGICCGCEIKKKVLVGMLRK